MDLNNIEKIRSLMLSYELMGRLVKELDDRNNKKIGLFVSGFIVETDLVDNQFYEDLAKVIRDTYTRIKNEVEKL